MSLLASLIHSSCKSIATRLKAASAQCTTYPLLLNDVVQFFLPERCHISSSALLPWKTVADISRRSGVKVSIKSVCVCEVAESSVLSARGELRALQDYGAAQVTALSAIRAGQNSALHAGFCLSGASAVAADLSRQPLQGRRAGSQTTGNLQQQVQRKAGWTQRR